jgi:hypothetical protein
VGRSFIEPNTFLRQSAVLRKFSPLTDNIDGKRVSQQTNPHLHLRVFIVASRIVFLRITDRGDCFVDVILRAIIVSIDASRVKTERKQSVFDAFVDRLFVVSSCVLSGGFTDMYFAAFVRSFSR